MSSNISQKNNSSSALSTLNSQQEDKFIYEQLHLILPLIPTGLVVFYHQTMSSLDFNYLKNKKNTSDDWFVFLELKKFENKILVAKETVNIKDEITALIDLAEVYRQQKYFGEAYQQLINAKTYIEGLSTFQFDPQLDYLNSRCMFLISKIMKELKKEEDAKNYLISAKTRAENLVLAIVPHHFNQHQANSLIYSSQILLCEILLEEAKQLIQQKEYTKALSEFLILSLKMIIASDAAKKKNTILNLTVFRELCFEIAFCLKMKQNYDLAKQYLSKPSNTFGDDDDAAEIREKYSKLKQDIEKQEEELRKEEAAKNEKKKTVNLSKFNESDDDDDWGVGKASASKAKLKPSTTTAKSKSKFAESDEEEDDWGASAPAAKTSKPSVGKGLLVFKKEEEIQDPIQDEIFPDKYRFFKSRYNQTDAIPNKPSSSLDTPKVTELHFLKFKDGKTKFESAQEMKKFLQSFSCSIVMDWSFSVVTVVEKMYTEFQYIEKFSPEWAKEYYQIVWKLFHLNTAESKQMCMNVLIEYFNQLPHAKMTENVDQEDMIKMITIFNYSLEMLRIAARFFTPQSTDAAAFYAMKESISKFYPKHSDAVLLIEIEAYCHNYNLLCKNDPQNCIDKIVKTLIQIFETHFAAVEKVSDVGISNLYNSNHLHLMPSSVDLACQALIILHFYLMCTSPLTLNYVFGEEEEDYSHLGPDIRSVHHKTIEDDTTRVNAMKKLYSKLPSFSITKALAAYTLGQYYRFEKRDYDIAEQFYFEAIFVFDKMVPFSPLIPTCVYDYTLKSLLEFADVLAKKNKYYFACVAYRVAVDNSYLCNTDYNYDLINNLAQLSSKNDDRIAALHYLKILQSKAKNEKDVAKFVFLAEKLSEEQMERGHFDAAEKHIIEAVEYIKTNLSGSKGGDYELNLQLKLADLFLHGYYFERGIDLLAKLLDTQQLTSIQKGQVYQNLAEAYLKKRWLKECEYVLNRLGPLLEQDAIKEAKGIDEIKILEIAAKCYFRNGKYPDSIHAVNLALQKTPSNRSPILGRLLLLKGKIFHKFALTCTPASFPTSLGEEVFKNPFFQRFKLESKVQQKIRNFTQQQFTVPQEYSKRDIYNNPGEVLEDCLLCYKKAEYIFKVLVSDRVTLAKIQLLTARAQIDCVFVPIAMLNAEPDAVVYISSKKEFELFKLKQLEIQYVIPAIENAVNTYNIFLCIDSYITMAELRYLQGRKTSAQAFWTECRNVVFTLFMDEGEVVVSKGAPPGFLEKILHFLRRLVRLLFCFNSTFINGNLGIIDAYLILEIEIEQVLKRTSEFQPEKYTSDSLDEELTEENMLVVQNRFYESLPCNSSIGKDKSLPFLRRRNTLTSRSMFTRKKKENGIVDAKFAVIERLWSCFYRIKQHARRYSSQQLSDQDLAERNQQSAKRLHNLMNAIRKKKIINPGFGEEKFENEKEEEESATGLNNKLSRLSLTKGDMELVKYYLKSINNDQNTTSPFSMSHSMSFRHARKNSILMTDMLSATPSAGSNLDVDSIARLLYILYVEDLIIYYLPKIGLKVFQKYGGKKVSLIPNEKRRSASLHSNTSTPTPTSGVLSSFSFLKATGSMTSEQAKSISSIPYKQEMVSKWIKEEYDQYLSALILQGRREKDKTKSGVENTEQIVDQLMNVFKAPYHYSTEHPESYSLEYEQRISAMLKSSSQNSSLDSPKESSLLKTKSLSLKNKINSAKKKDLFVPYPALSEVKITEKPLLLLCSHFLQIIPWELMFEEFTTRVFSLQHVLQRRKKKSIKEKFIPVYFSFYSDDDPKYIGPLEKQRKEWLAEYVKKKLNLFPTDSGILHDYLPNVPLHCPLVKHGKKPKNYRNKYRFVNFVKLSLIAKNPTQIITHIESNLGPSQYPVFIFTVTDLIDLSEAILALLQYLPECTLLFIPESQVIAAVEFLMDMQTNYIKNGQLINCGGLTGYKFFTHCIHSLQTYLHIPVVVINPPYL